MGEPTCPEEQENSQNEQNSLLRRVSSDGRFRYQSLMSVNSRISLTSSLGASFSGRHSNVVTCPTCQGLGRVPKESEEQLMALIPMSDRRLKPRRTLIYVLVAIGVCVITAGLLVFFLIPRNIVINSNRPFLQSDHVFVDAKTEFANFTVHNFYNVSNDNFYPVTLTHVYMKAQMANEVLAETQFNSSLEIGMRSHINLTVPMTFVLRGRHGSLVEHCTNPVTWIHNLPIQFEVDIQYSFMAHSEQETLNTYQLVSCYPDSPIVTTVHPRTMRSTSPGTETLPTVTMPTVPTPLP